MAKKLFLNFSFTLLALMLCMGVLCNYSKAANYSGNQVPDEQDEFIIEKLQRFVQAGRLTQAQLDTFYNYANGSNYVMANLYESNNEFVVAYYTSMNVVENVTNNTPLSLYAGAHYIASSLYGDSLTRVMLRYDSRGLSCFTSSWNNLTSSNSTSKGIIYYGIWNTYNYIIGNNMGSTNTMTNYYSTNETSFSCGYVYGGGNYIFTPTWIEYTSYTEDDRLTIYNLETNSGKLLNIDVSAFRSGYSAATTKVFSDIDITLDCDGSEVEYTLDSNNSNIIDIWSASNNVHTVQTLYSYFDLDSFDDVYIKYVSFSLTTSSAGGSSTDDYNISCEYYLKKTHESMEPVIVPDPEYNNTEIYNTTQINNIKQDLHEYSSRFSFLQGSWNFVLDQDLPEFPGWATVYQNYVWFADGNSDTTYRGHWFQMANNIPSIADLTRPFDPSEFLEQNKTFAFYDVILLKVFTVEVLSGSSVIENYDLAGYLVFISDRYYDHYNARLNLDILTQLQLSAENSVLFFDAAKARLDGIASDLDTGFNVFLDVGTGTQYKIISWLQTINDNMSGSFISLENTLSDGFSSVVTAIGNITPGGSSYSLPALSEALSFLFTPTLEWSAINYDDYQESLGVLALPFEFTFDVLDICESQYDPKFKIHLNDLSLDVPLESGSDPEMTSFTVFEDQDIVQDPLDVFPSGLWSTLQYLNAFGLVMLQALSTYLHIFRKE